MSEQKDSYLSPAELSKHDQAMLDIDGIAKNDKNRSGIDSFVKKVRTPEARTSLSNVYAEIVTKYASEIYKQQPLPELAQRFMAAHGVVAVSGSLLRGTAHPASDLDIPLYYDSRAGEVFQSFHDPGNLMRLGPAGGDLEEFVLDELAENPAYQRELAFKKSYRDKWMPNSAHPLAPYNGAEVAGIDIAAVSKLVQPGQKMLPCYYKMLSELLTIPQELVYETTDGNLLLLQQTFIRDLLILRKKDPDQFAKLFAELQFQFKGSLVYTSKKNPAWDKMLVDDYVSRSGRFKDEEKARAASLLMAVRKQKELPDIDVLAEIYGVETS